MKNFLQNILKKKENNSGATPQKDEGEKSNKKINSLIEKIKSKFSSGIKNKLGKQAIQGEEIVGVELTPYEIRLAQLNKNKNNEWVLEKFFVHTIEGLPENASVLEHPDKIGDELKIALQKSKIETTNAAIAIPVTSAIIRVVTAPLMLMKSWEKQLIQILYGKILFN